ncbi:putative polysaccharide biosynthesis protein [uncultured Flavonifractor sp.]|uniref:putative polysaccharide biosynthesis protein n=1 Tax=uncultured Flavonifractor sp. TaxID=1193534 RepID=UPI00262FE05D|nr:polysaccharide biosynthesis protein [uncultured Flavonifractor sp.]
MSNQQKKNTFYGAAAFLAMTTIIVKVIGAIYKIPLTALLPDEAYGDFNAAYNIYTFFLTISTAGLPVALSKTVSECNTLGRQNQKARVFQVAFFAFLFMGLFSFICMSVFSPIVATYVLKNEKAVFAVLALSPAVLCTCICSAFRGYAQGHMNMIPTGVSQVIEALSKMFLGLALAFLILNSAIPDQDLKTRLSASGALLGVSIGSILSVVYLAFNHIRTNRGERVKSTDTPDRSKQILSRLLKLAVPITLSSCTLSIVNLIDTNLVQSQLQSVFTAIQDGLTGISNSVLDIFPKAVAIFQDNLAAFQTEVLTNPDTKLNPILDSARELYGVYSKTMSIYNLPFNLMVPFTACIVPAVSACIARRDRLGAHRTTESAMRISALIALPCGFGLFALGTPIIQLLTVGNVDETIAGPLLSILGIASFFVCIQVVASAILQANGIINLPIITMIIGGVAKVIVSYTLVGNPKYMIFGAPVGTLTCFVVVSVLNLLIIKRLVPQPPRLMAVFVKPVIASALMAAAAWGCHGVLARVFHGSFLMNAVAVGGAILAGVVVYVILIVALRVLSKEDMEMMPKGDKIAKLLHIR